MKKWGNFDKRNRNATAVKKAAAGWGRKVGHIQKPFGITGFWNFFGILRNVSDLTFLKCLKSERKTKRGSYILFTFYSLLLAISIALLEVNLQSLNDSFWQQGKAS